MNAATRRALMTMAAQQAQNHPADIRRPLAQGTARYRRRLWAIHVAVLFLAALMLGAGLWTMQGADSTDEDTTTVIEPTPIVPPSPVDPEPTARVPTVPELVDIDLDPPSLAMVPGRTLQVRAIGIYDNGSEEEIPASQLSWSVDNVDELLDISAVASVDQTTGVVAANRSGRAILTVSMQEAEDLKDTADIIVRNRRDFVGPTDLAIRTTSPPPAVP